LRPMTMPSRVFICSRNPGPREAPASTAMPQAQPPATDLGHRALITAV
jgi:hypothetical protein